MKKDGNGNIIISEIEFRELINSMNQNTKTECKKILEQKYIFNTVEGGYYLQKKYENQNEIIPWSGEDAGKVRELFKNTRIKYEEPKNLKPITDETPIKGGSEPLGVDENGWVVCKPEQRPWLIERVMRCDYAYLIISEDGIKNRPWKQSEIEKISKIFNDVPRSTKIKRILND
jgi:hypothetical protein